MPGAEEADVGCAAAHARLLAARGLDPKLADRAAVARAASLLRRDG